VLLGLLSLACGRTPLHRCDLVGCAQGTCIDAGKLLDGTSNEFCCLIVDAGTRCVGAEESCGTCGTCCGGLVCAPSGLCEVPAAQSSSDAGR